MTITRAFHTATLLNNGSVLVAGGSVDGTENLLSSAELFNPDTRKFALTGSLTEPLASQTATLLLNGKVLIDGGDNGTDTVADAELYDPATGMFSFTGFMTTPRVFNTLTLLTQGPLKGQVLVTGGLDDSDNTLNSAELYNPSTGKFTATGSMKAKRSQHTATLLLNGQVLIAGGIDNDGNSLSSTELFDPVCQTFSFARSMNTARGIHTANLLNNGNVLVAGGIDLIAGVGPVLSTGEVYVEGYFGRPFPMVQSRVDFTATTLLDDSVLLAGGSDNNNRVLSGTELYLGPGFESNTSMTVPRWFHTATLLLNSRLAGAVLVTGGLDSSGNNALKSTELYGSNLFP